MYAESRAGETLKVGFHVGDFSRSIEQVHPVAATAIAISYIRFIITRAVAFQTLDLEAARAGRVTDDQVGGGALGDHPVRQAEIESIFHHLSGGSAAAPAVHNVRGSASAAIRAIGERCLRGKCFGMSGLIRFR